MCKAKSVAKIECFNIFITSLYCSELKFANILWPCKGGRQWQMLLYWSLVHIAGGFGADNKNIWKRRKIAEVHLLCPRCKYEKENEKLQEITNQLLFLVQETTSFSQVWNPNWSKKKKKTFVLELSKITACDKL